MLREHTRCVIMLGSETHHLAERTGLPDPNVSGVDQLARGYDKFDPLEAYGTSKLLSMTLAKEFARRYPADSEILSYSPDLTLDTALFRAHNAIVKLIAPPIIRLYTWFVGGRTSTSAYSGGWMARLASEEPLPVPNNANQGEAERSLHRSDFGNSAEDQQVRHLPWGTLPRRLLSCFSCVITRETLHAPETQLDDGSEAILSQDLFAMTVTKPPKRKKTRTKKVTSKSRKTQTRLGKPQRKKSPGTIKEKEFKKGKTYSGVVCRLETICLDSLLCDEIRRSAHAMKQIQLEAWHLANLHTLRCLKNGLPLPDYSNKTFFDHCCAGVSTTSHTHLIAQKNPDLWETIKIYQSQRGRAGLSEVTHLTGYSELKCELREQMLVNAGVVIREHFRTRLRLYVDITFGGLGSTLTKKQRKDKADLVKDIMHACYSVDETDVVEALQMRDVLTPDGVGWSEQWIPWPSHIKENGMAFYVRLLWEFQDVVEKRMEAVPNEKGVRAFSLFPVSTIYSRAHITINGTTLAGFYMRIQQRVPEYRWNLPDVSLSVSSFKENRWTVMRRAFDIAQYETRLPECPFSKTEFAQLSVEEKYEHVSHLFANQVTTDGYSASVLMYRPKTEEEKAEKKFDEKSTEYPVVPPGYVPNVMIGLDPGMRAICTAVREDFRPEDQRDRRRRRRRRRQPRRPYRKRGSTRKKKSDRPHWIRRPKAPRHRNDRDIISVTTREYRHLAGFNRFRAWNEGQKKRHPEYQAIIAEMPSFKTASYEKYLERLEYFWHHVRFLMQFCVDRPFLKWRFFRKRMARVAVDEIA